MSEEYITAGTTTTTIYGLDPDVYTIEAIAQYTETRESHGLAQTVKTGGACLLTVYLEFYSGDVGHNVIVTVDNGVPFVYTSPVSVPMGSTVTLLADPHCISGNCFLSWWWGMEISSNNNPEDFEISGDLEVTATFGEY